MNLIRTKRTMKRLKRDDGEKVDRLSSLPMSLVFEILSFLETKDVVKTSLLSKGWKDLWTTIPYLKFINESGENLVGTRNLINGVLQGWKGTKILRFKISLLSAKCDDVPLSLYNDMVRWICFATEKKVEELDLRLPCKVGPLVDEPPECLYSCSSFTTLRLYGFRFQTERGIYDNVRWGQLRSLHMCGYLMNEELQQLVSSAPQLEDLFALVVVHSGNLSVRSSCLKKLELYILCLSSSYARLTIWTPNLEELRLSGHILASERFELHAPDLTQVYLSLRDNGDVEKINQFILPIQHVEALSLRLFFLRSIIGVMKGRCLLPNVKILELITRSSDEVTDGVIEDSDIVGVAELFPKVEKLIIHCKEFGENNLQSVANTLNSLLPQNGNVRVLLGNKRKRLMYRYD